MQNEHDVVEDQELEEANQTSEKNADDDRRVTNPVKAIRKYCLECCRFNPNEVKLCPVENCQLHPFRFGKNPYRTARVMTEEQKAAAIARLAEARERKAKN